VARTHTPRVLYKLNYPVHIPFEGKVIWNCPTMTEFVER